MKLKWQAYWTLALFAVLAGPTAQAQATNAGEAAVVKRQADLREAPGEASRAIAPLAPQTAITRLPERQGAWVQVRTAQGQTGWLHIFDVASPNAPSQSSNVAAGALRGVTGFFGRSSGPNMASTSTSTVGIRGLGAEDLANAQPNMNAVTQAEGNRLDSGAAQQFAQQARLTPHPVVALPEPPRPRSPNNTGGQPGQPGNNAF